MANILQVTPPGVNTDNKTLSTGQEANSQLIQNPVDLSRVTRADGREGGKTEDAARENSYNNIIDYGSNYGAFVKSLGENQELSALMERLLFADLAGAGRLGQADGSSYGSAGCRYYQGSSPAAAGVYYGTGRLSDTVWRRFF